MLTLVSIIGALLTVLFVPESKDKNLEEASREEIATPTASEWELKRRKKKKLYIFHRYPLNLSFFLSSLIISSKFSSKFLLFSATT